MGSEHAVSCDALDSCVGCAVQKGVETGSGTRRSEIKIDYVRTLLDAAVRAEAGDPVR